LSVVVVEHDQAPVSLNLCHDMS